MCEPNAELTVRLRNGNVTIYHLEHELLPNQVCRIVVRGARIYFSYQKKRTINHPSWATSFSNADTFDLTLIQSMGDARWTSYFVNNGAVEFSLYYNPNCCPPRAPRKQIILLDDSSSSDDDSLSLLVSVSESESEATKPKINEATDTTSVTAALTSFADTITLKEISVPKEISFDESSTIERTDSAETETQFDHCSAMKELLDEQKRLIVENQSQMNKENQQQINKRFDETNEEIGGIGNQIAKFRWEWVDKERDKERQRDEVYRRILEWIEDQEAIQRAEVEKRLQAEVANSSSLSVAGESAPLRDSTNRTRQAKGPRYGAKTAAKTRREERREQKSKAKGAMPWKY